MSRLAQVSSYVYRESPAEPGSAEYLALHRPPERGNFWQSVTGGVEFEDYTLAHAARREVSEEIDVDFGQIHTVKDTGYSFTFVDKKEGPLREYVFGVGVDSDVIPKFTEHDAGLWVSYAGLRELVAHRWPENTEGLDIADNMIRTSLPNSPKQSFDQTNWTLMIVKPDAFELGIEQEVMERVHDIGLTVVLSQVSVQLDHEDVDKIWIPPKTLDPWYYATVDYMTRRPVDVHLLRGDNATQRILSVKNELRQQYDRNHRDNMEKPVEARIESIIHCSDRMEELARQSIAFFGPEEIYKQAAGA